VIAGIWPEWLMVGGMVRTVDVGHRRPSRYHGVAAAFQIEARQPGSIQLVLRQKLQHHLILVRGGIDLRYLLAAKRQPQRRLMSSGVTPQGCRPRPVDCHPDSGCHLVLVAIDATKVGSSCIACTRSRDDCCSSVKSRPLQGILIGRTRLAPADTDDGGLLKVMAVPGMLRSLRRNSLATWSADSFLSDSG